MKNIIGIAFCLNNNQLECKNKMYFQDMILFWVYAAVHFLDEKVMVPVQIWRMIDLIYRPEEEVLAELDSFKSHILTCSS